MASLSSIKPFLPFILTFLVPRGLSYYRALKTAIKTRPPSRPLPAKTSRSLNILFLSICLFSLLSFPALYSQSHQLNIFEVTNSRFHIPTDVLFNRLALIRPLTPSDEALREKITTPVTRTLYLRYGSPTLLTCPFCYPTHPDTYTLHHLPTHILLPHLTHLLFLGLATSTPFDPATSPSHSYRTSLTLSALALALLDTYLCTTYPLPIPNPQSTTPPRGLYWTALTIRPLAICLLDALFAAAIYLSATGRLPFLFPGTAAAAAASRNPEVVKERQLRSLLQSNVALQTALTKLRAVGVVRSAVVRDGGTRGGGGGGGGVEGLKERDDEYWRVVVGMEGMGGCGKVAGRGNEDADGAVSISMESVWEEEEVMQAVAAVTGSRGARKDGKDAKEGEGEKVDVERVRKEAALWVQSVTSGLEAEDEDEAETKEEKGHAS